MNHDKLRLAVVRLLPKQIEIKISLEPKGYTLTWIEYKSPVRPTDMLEVCHRIEKTLDTTQREQYIAELINISHYPYTEIFADWVDKAKALCKVAGIAYEVD